MEVYFRVKYAAEQLEKELNQLQIASEAEIAGLRPEQEQNARRKLAPKT